MPKSLDGAPLYAVPAAPDGPMATTDFLAYLNDGPDTGDLSHALRSILQRRHALARYERKRVS